MTARTILRLALLLVVAGTLTACDDSSQNIGWEPGDSLAIIGETEIALSEPDADLPAEDSYYVQAFTIEKDYTWNVEGPGTPDYSVRREGEYADVTFPEEGNYIISIDDGVEYDGEVEVRVVPTVLAEIERSYASLFAASEAAGIDGTLEDASGVTVFAPTEAAFEPVLESLDGELPAPGVLADILTYHVLAAQVPSGDIEDGADAATLYGESFPLSFDVSDGGVSVNGAANSATVTDTDIPVANSVALHEIDTVLLPPTASVDVSDQAVVVEEGVTTATVDGVYVPADGGFAAVEDADGNVLGVSDYIAGGIVNGVSVELDAAVEEETEVSVVMYSDDGDEAFDADADTPYERGEEVVSDDATLTPAE